MTKSRFVVLATISIAAAWATAAAAAPPTVEMTWMSMANWYFKIGDKRIVMDGYITRVPESLFRRVASVPEGHVHVHQGAVRR